MGTVNNDKEKFYRGCIESFKDTEYQVIISAGSSVSSRVFEKLPKNISVFESVDQIAVLCKADVFVSHCGMNSASESLYFGVPIVTFPQTPEQGAVAKMVLRLGAGIKPKKGKGDFILKAVEKILSEKSFKKNAEKISEGFKKCSGAKGAADKILSVCRK